MRMRMRMRMRTRKNETRSPPQLGFVRKALEEETSKVPGKLFTGTTLNQGR